MSKFSMRLTTVFALAAVLGACASGGDYKQYVDAQMEAIRQHQAQAKPLVSIKAQAGQTISGLESIEINVPGQAPLIQQARGNEWAPVIGQAIGALGIVGGIVAGGHAAVGIANAVGNAARVPQANVITTTSTALGGSGVIGNGSYSTSISNQATTTTQSVGGAGVIGSGSFSQPTTTDNHAVTNSNNPTTDNHAVDNHAVDTHATTQTCATGPC